MSNPNPFPLPERPEQFQLTGQWAERYLPSIKYGARLDSSQIVGGNITVEDTGMPVGVFDTLDFVGATVTDNGDGSVTIEVGADISTVDWTTTNWTNFFTDIDWSANTDWTSFFTNIDWSDNTNWDNFVSSVVTNWSATNWDNFIDTFITNVDSDDVFNFLNQIAGTAKGDILVFNGSTWALLNAGADGLFLQANSASATGLQYAAGGGGSPLTVQDEGINVDTNTTQINFTGTGVTATSAGVGLVDVTINAAAAVTSITATANEDMAQGTPVGYGADGNVSRAVRAIANNDTNRPASLSTGSIVKVEEMDTDKFAVLYRYTSGTAVGAVVIMTIDSNANEVTYGTEVVIDSNIEQNGPSIDMAKLDTNKFVVTWTDDTANDAEAIVGTVSGSTITLGTGQVLTVTGTLVSATCCQLDTDKFGFMYGTTAAGARYQGFATVSGTVITVVDSDTTAIAGVNNLTGLGFSSIKIATDKFVVVNGQGGNTVVCTTVGVTFAFGAVTTIVGSGATGELDLLSPTTDEFWVRFNAKTAYATVSGTTITEEDDYTYTASAGCLVADGSDVYNVRDSAQIDLIVFS
ncbi:MAG: hypothetical protein ACXABY_06675, partial [Candidatus Thorarchaeota archaeon]